jgi:hypothetical protein
MWCARCGRDDTELVWVMTSLSRKTVLPMCVDDRLCYPPKDIKKYQLCKVGIQNLEKLNYRQFNN